MVLHACLYVFIKHLQLRYGPLMDAVLSAFIVVLAADICVMAYLYRTFYGRSILEELNEDGKEQWNWDADQQTYTRKSVAEKTAKELQAAMELVAVKEAHDAALLETRKRLDAEKRAAEIRENKARIRAACVIQRWWRNILYLPPNGRFYKAARSSFEASKSSDEEMSLN